MKQGPSTRVIPSVTETVCNGCAYLHTIAGMRGRDTVTNSFVCIHPDYKNDTLGYGLGMSPVRGKMIEYHIEGSCPNPDWCPCLKNKKNPDL